MNIVAIVALNFILMTSAHAANTPKLICDVSYVTIGPDGRRIEPVLTDSHSEETIAQSEEYGNEASILKRTKDCVDFSVTLTGGRLMASLGYGSQQSSYSGLIQEAGSFGLSLFYRNGDVLINGQMASSILLKCSTR